MKLPALKNIKWNYPAIAFLIPLVGMLIVMMCNRYVPFGPYAMLYSDMYHQYYPFFVDFRRQVLKGNGLLYTWSMGMGIDYLGLISYYLVSPFTLLGLLTPESLLLQVYSLIMPLKLGFAGLNFALLLKKLFDRDDLSVSLFGGFYALCAWALCYQWNVMWLDTFALLPLVVLGTTSLLREKRFFLYTVTLFLSVFLNYYVGLFTCVFVFLLFFCYEICRWRGFRRFFADFCRIAFFSVLAIGMTAILELPALAALQNTQSSVNTFPKGFQLNIAKENTWRGLLDALRQTAGKLGGGGEDTDFRQGLPKLYCGVGTVLLAFLFLTSGKVRLRDKLCSAALLLFFALSFVIRQLDYIWHGFHFTNMVPYRFSFLFSFVLLYMAYRAYLQRDRFRVWQVAVAFVLALLVLACSDRRTDVVYLVYNLSFLLLYVCVLLCGILRKRAPAPEPVDAPPEAGEMTPETAEAVPETGEAVPVTGEAAPVTVAAPPPRVPLLRERTAALVLGIVMGLELIADLVYFGCYFPGYDITNYPKGTTDTAAAVRFMEERESGTLFYRAEVAHTQSNSDNALIGVNGVSAYTSSANVRVTEFMRTLGCIAQNTYNRYCFEEGSPVTNLFLGLKYMLERDGQLKENNYFTQVWNSGKVYLLENNAYLPLGFLADSALGEVDFTQNTDPFAFQNELLTAASGVGGPFWSSVPTSALDITASEGVELTPTVSSRYCSYKLGGESGTVSFSYTAHRSGLLCLRLSSSKQNSFRVYKNGEELYSDSYVLPQVLSACQAEPGDVFEFRMYCGANTQGTLTVRAAILDEDLFRRAYNVLAASTLELTRFESTRVEGRIDCGRDGLLYTSVPWDGNWQVFVDGEAAEPVLVGGCMIALPLTEGVHTVALRYRNAAFSLGWKITLVCAALFLAALCLRYRSRLVSSHGKHVKRRRRG